MSLVLLETGDIPRPGVFKTPPLFPSLRNIPECSQTHFSHMLLVSCVQMNDIGKRSGAGVCSWRLEYSQRLGRGHL